MKVLFGRPTLYPRTKQTKNFITTVIALKISILTFDNFFLSALFGEFYSLLEDDKDRITFRSIKMKALNPVPSGQSKRGVKSK